MAVRPPGPERVLIVADVHGAAPELARLAGRGEPLLVLGDLINFIDYRTNEGIVSTVSGRPFVDEMVRLRTSGDFRGAGELWAEFSRGREDELRRRYAEEVSKAYEEICAALTGIDAYVTYGNVDRPDLLADSLPPGSRFVDGEVVEIEGRRIGFAGGGMISIGTPGEITEEAMAAKLARLGEIDVLATHVPPAVPALASDVIGGRQKGSRAVLDFILERRPPYHYFGDIHQPQALEWRIGPTRCRNVGYFRATGRAYRHP